MLKVENSVESICCTRFKTYAVDPSPMYEMPKRGPDMVFTCEFSGIPPQGSWEVWARARVGTDPLGQAPMYLSNHPKCSLTRLSLGT